MTFYENNTCQVDGTKQQRFVVILTIYDTKEAI